MNELDDRIVRFLKKMHLASLAVVDESHTPHAASSFYAFNEQDICVIIAGDKKTTHIKCALKASVAGTIALDTRVVGRIEGVQFRGSMSQASEYARQIYFRRFPYALAMKPEIWQINLEWIKYTSNLLGFGKKIVWIKQPTSQTTPHL